MKPRIAFTKTLSFSALSLSLLATSAFGQLIEITEPNTETQATQTEGVANAVPQELRSTQQNGISTQPVSMSAAMAPQVAPQPTLTVPSVTSGIGGNNPGNANTGGVQVQSVNVTALQDSSTNTNTRADLLRRERLRRELENETRLIEKIEEGRLEDESKRAKAVDGFSSALPAEVQAQSVTPVVVASAAPVYSQYAPETSALSTTVKSSSNDSNFRLSPFAGYRWYRNSSFSQLNMENLFVAGVGIEGSITKYLGIEGAFTYGRDQVDNNVAFVGMTPAYGYNYGYNYNNFGFNNFIRTRDTFEFTGALKLALPVEKVRPFGVVGVGYLRQKYNIDNSFTTIQANDIGWDRSTNHAIGMFGGGIDLDVAEYLALGVRFDYQSVINKRNTQMHMIYGDAKDRMKLTGQLQLTF